MDRRLETLLEIIYLIILILVLATSAVSANGDEAEGGLFGEEGAESLGSIAWNLGLLLNTGFVVFNRARKIFRLRVPFLPILNLHISTNIVLGIAGILHGYAYLSYARPLEYLTVALIIFLIVSGLILRYVRSRDLKLLNRLVHTQLALAILLALSIWIHTVTIED